ncbi:helix-turn-helix domain-containing protein [Flavivirga rizhaonensis]|uniref:Helix-turn-helix domain-containing protein n=1 Tax=Flavivirga rizhaonensis TaxID=2559571 RepID=A0A4S1DV30_9FLAO|nr:helix-turn-helix domain-containing protein [Flavivirga rizhaonensis]TGV01318.1 helix-turn-helix domain-containing protein [Flavivirga rizhaonensis]
MADIENIGFTRFINQPIDFEIISIEELYQRCRESNFDISISHRIQFHALIIVTEGKGFHNVDFNEIILSPGVVIPLVKNQVNYFQKELQVNGYVISFKESFITDNIGEKDLFHFLHLFNTKSLLIGEENIPLLIPYLELLKSMQKSNNQNLKSDLAKNIFLSLLIQIKRLTVYQHEIFESRHFKDFIQFKQLITQHYQDSHDAKFYAKKMLVSYKYLNEICKELGNVTAKAFIDNWILLEIKRNLSEKKYTTQEIAFKVGFDEPSNFIRFFKRHEGITPSKFANQL